MSRTERVVNFLPFAQGRPNSGNTLLGRECFWQSRLSRLGKENMANLEGFLYGLFGGLLAELLNWFKHRQEEPSKIPVLKSPFYWILTGAMILSGGGLVVVYLQSDIPLKPILAVNVGASAPLIIGLLIAQTPPLEPGRPD